MKAKIHPNWFPEAKVICACGNVFTTGSTMAEVKVDVCSVCHPFYTGQMKFVDAAGRVDAFKAKMKATKDHLSKNEKRRIKKAKQLAEEAQRPTTLSELRGK